MNSSNPKLSIVTINLNDRVGLEKTIVSVREQKFRDLEHIVIDGGSSDGSLETIGQYSDGIAYWVSEKDKGIYDAQNKGILAARGDYCQFLNAGDFLVDPGALRRVFETGASEDIIYGDMLVDYGDGGVAYGKSPPTLDLAFLVYGVLWHCVAFIRADLFKKYGLYDTTYEIAADVDFFLKAIGTGRATWRYVPGAISQFNARGFGSDPKNTALLEMERERMRASLPPLVASLASEYHAIRDEYEIFHRSGLVSILRFIRANSFLSGILRFVSRPLRQQDKKA